jgi:hypothetical protein
VLYGCATDSIRVPNALIVDPPAENRGLLRRNPPLRSAFILLSKYKRAVRSVPSAVNRAPPPTYAFKLTRWDEKAGLPRDAIGSQ